MERLYCKIPEGSWLHLEENEGFAEDSSLGSEQQWCSHFHRVPEGLGQEASKSLCPAGGPTSSASVSPTPAHLCVFTDSPITQGIVLF